MSYTIRIRRDTTSNWSTINPVLSLGELGYNTTLSKFKIGDGTTAWNDLTYLSFSDLPISALNDVQLTSIQNNDVLQYNTSLSKWVNNRQTNLTDGGNF